MEGKGGGACASLVVALKLRACRLVRMCGEHACCEVLLLGCFAKFFAKRRVPMLGNPSIDPDPRAVIRDCRRLHCDGRNMNRSTQRRGME